MLTLNQSTGDNNEAIWVLKINTPTPIYLSTRDITLDNVYDGQVLNFNNYLSDITQTSTIKDSGGVGAVTSFGFSISRYNKNTSLDGFFNEFYPATAGVYLTSVIVNIGIVWVGASADTDITWLMSGRIVDYKYQQRVLDLIVFQQSETTNKELPYYSIQKDFNNEVSYYPNAPKENISIPIPIIYGSLNVFNPVPKSSTGVSVGIALTPAYLVDPAKLEYVICSHQVLTMSWNQHGKSGDTNLLFKYLNGVDTYMLCFKIGDSGSSYSNNVIRHSFKFMYTVSRIYGDLYLQLKQVSGYTNQNDVADAIDGSPTTFSQIDRFEITATNLMALNILSGESSGEVGFFGSAAGSILVTWAIKLEDDSSGNYRTGIRNNTLSTPANSESSTLTMAGATITEITGDLSGVTSIKRDATLPWTIEEIADLEYYIVNYGANTVGKKINIYYGFIQISNINVTGSKLSGKGWIKTPTIKGTHILILGGYRR